jgi:hypothetical protein
VIVGGAACARGVSRADRRRGCGGAWGESPSMPDGVGLGRPGSRRNRENCERCRGLGAPWTKVQGSIPTDSRLQVRLRRTISSRLRSVAPSRLRCRGLSTRASDCASAPASEVPTVALSCQRQSLAKPDFELAIRGVAALDFSPGCPKSSRWLPFFDFLSSRRLPLFRLPILEMAALLAPLTHSSL